MKIKYLVIIGLLVIASGCEKTQDSIKNKTKQEIQKSSKNNLEKQAQSMIMTAINKYNPNAQPGAQAAEMMTGSATSSLILVSSKKFNEKLYDFLTSIGANSCGENFFGIPLNYTIYSSKSLPDSTPYMLHSKVEVKTDPQTIYRASKLYNHSNFLKKYEFNLDFGFAYPGPGRKGYCYELDKDFLMGRKNLSLDVKLFRQDINSNWNSYIILLDKSNDLKLIVN